MNRLSTVLLRSFTSASLLFASPLIAVIPATVLIAPSSAAACRDCPFPMRIGDNRWIMPDESFVITIVEKELPDHRFSVMVRLTDPITGRILASGGTKRKHDQSAVVVPMRDRLGGKVIGKIRWIDREHKKIQVHFQCASGYDCLD